MTAIDQLFLRVRAEPFFWRFTLFTRILLATAFLPTGMVKLLGQRFTLLGVDSPVGAFFEAMYQTGLYWNFLGLSQVIAALLLLLPRWAHIGALLFLPIIGNIFVITTSIDFAGTPVVTGLMLLATVYLCAWDWHRHRSIWTQRPWPPAVEIPEGRLDPVERLGFGGFSAAIVLLFFALRFGVPHRGLVIGCLLLGTSGGLLALGRFLALRWRDPLRLRAAAS